MGIIKVAFLKEHDIFPLSKRIAASATFWNIQNYRIWSGDTIFLGECIDKGIHTLRITGRPLYIYRRHDHSETMSNAPDMVKRRRFGKFCTALLFGYVALQNKEQYTAERMKNGTASQEITIATIVKQREAVLYLSVQPNHEWKSGLKLFDEKGFFFFKKPPEYTFSLWSYLKNQALINRFRPSTISAYFLFTKCGAIMYRFFTSLGRYRANNDLVIRAKKARKRRRLIKAGIKQQ